MHTEGPSLLSGSVLSIPSMLKMSFRKPSPSMTNMHTHFQTWHGHPEPHVQSMGHLRHHHGCESTPSIFHSHPIWPSVGSQPPFSPQVDCSLSLCTRSTGTSIPLEQQQRGPPPAPAPRRSGRKSNRPVRLIEDNTWG